MVGGEIGSEIEVLILGKVGLRVGIKEMWSGLCVKKWKRVWNGGLKIVVYK